MKTQKSKKSYKNQSEGLINYNINDEDHLEGVQHIIESLKFMFASKTSAVSLIEVKDGNYIYIHTNELQKKWSGVQDPESKSILDMYEPEEAKRIRSYFEKSYQEEIVLDYEAEATAPEGIRIIHSEVTPITYKNKKKYLIIASKDITKHKEMQLQNEQLSQRLNAMFSQHLAMKLVFDPETGQILFANQSACRFYQREESELQKLTMQDLNAMPIDIKAETEACKGKNGVLLKSLPHFSADGEVRYMDIYTSLIKNKDKKYRYSIFFDVTEREMLKDQVAEEKELLRITLNSIGDGVVSTDQHGIIQNLNFIAEKITGWTKDEARGKRFEEVFCLYEGEERTKKINPVQEVLEKGEIIKLTRNTQLINMEGNIVPISNSAAPIQTADGKVHGVVVVFRDVSAENEHVKQIEYMSYHDQLTGLYNRRYIEKIMYDLDCKESLPLIVALGDLNGLKLTNDVFGHKVGDNLLKNVADLLVKNTRPGDIVARWGGDEFVIFMPNTSKQEAEKVIKKITEERIQEEGNILNASITFGYSQKTSTQSNLDEALRLAEEEMYHHKLLEGKSFRNKVINTLLSTLSTNTSETKEHSERLEYYAHAIGRKLNLSIKELNNLSLLALLHDIGKIGMDVEILQKPGPLTEKEWEIMKTHPEIGYRITSSIAELAGISDLILSHHERWDGTGYPNNVHGESIPLGSRILAVADAYDAMTNDRPYRKKMPSQEAIAEIEKGAGSQFDPKIAKIFIEVLREEIMN